MSPNIEPKRAHNRWDEAKEATVVKLWQEGHSASVIGAHLGVSRNTVIGKVHRLGLQRFAAAPVVARPAPLQPKERVSMGLPPKPKPKPSEPPPEGGIDLMDVHYNRTCAFPVSGRGETLRYCGAGTNETTYCAKHRRVMYVTDKASRRA